ncbi:hypothetical protein pipiens_016528 [Culex pipiens pipiens]|uniref:Uncharacterized protein n=1 Tax=Culex pipiens pipiens TaxID=38569 RepID=A0ABD1CL92_CULPP
MQGRRSAENLAKLQADGESSSIKMDFDHGTTTLGFRLQGEVILAVDLVPPAVVRFTRTVCSDENEHDLGRHATRRTGMVMVHKYGADALRLYLINSPDVRAENLRFKEDGVKDIMKDVFLPHELNSKYINPLIERAVSRMQAVVEVGCDMRDRRIVHIKYSLTKVIVINQSKENIWTTSNAS